VTALRGPVLVVVLQQLAHRGERVARPHLLVLCWG
jgi:hypothetical protein